MSKQESTLNISVSVQSVLEGFRDHLDDYIEHLKQASSQSYGEFDEFPVTAIIACNTPIESAGIRANPPYLLHCLTKFYGETDIEVNHVKNAFVSFIRKLMTDGDAFAVIIIFDAWYTEMSAEEHEKFQGSIREHPKAREALYISVSRPGVRDRVWVSMISRDDNAINLGEFTFNDDVHMGRFSNFFDQVN